MALVEQYFRTQMTGQAEGTVDAKQRDLACFLTFYVQLSGHDDRREWYKSVTEAFLKALARGQVPRPSKRGPAPGPLFTTRSGKRLDRTQAFLILRRIARQANAHLPPDQHLIVSPHVLRHTLLRKVANEKGVHYAMELSGHRSDRYIWRYVKTDAQSLAEAIDELE
jgi:integrase